MIGSALGDAIGELAFEFPDKDALLGEMGRSELLRYTDDTAMAIGLAESIAEKGDIDPQHLGNRFQHNFVTEPWRGYASGPPTIFALVKRHKISYLKAAKSLFGGQGSLGNGAAMRIVPVALFFHDSPDLLNKARLSAQVTHAHPVGVDGAAIQALAIARAVDLDPLEAFPRDFFMEELIATAQTREIKEKMILVSHLVAERAPSKEAADKLGHSVAVHESMPFAIYTFARYPNSFEACLMCAVLHGGDRDTLGAMAGAISGAYLGIDAIPSDWVARLENRSYLEELAMKLYTIHNGKQGS
jgi:poly(ADP-ribose) glycohydrolase ARH3